MKEKLEALTQKAGISLFDYQEQFLSALPTMAAPLRTCLYYKTGAGKSFTSLAAVALLGYTDCIVIAPPSTHEQWFRLGQQLGVNVGPMSHAKFRMKGTKLSRKVPVIADEFHLFGGQRGQGWKKLDKLAQHLEAPLLLLSATPNYNDAERTYCVQHILDPNSCRGGYLQFLYQHCETEQNPFSMEPNVIGFLNHASAADFLASMPQVYYLPDDLVMTIQDVVYDEVLPLELIDYGYNRRKHSMVASIIEMAHTTRYQGLVTEDGHLHPHVLSEVLARLGLDPVLLFAQHSSIVEAIARAFDRAGLKYAVVTGSTPTQKKQAIINEFRSGQHKILIGTATLATGTDGLDKVCDTLIILDDTDDDALRRQLIGRITPRGLATNIASKQVFRLVPERTY